MSKEVKLIQNKKHKEILIHCSKNSNFKNKNYNKTFFLTNNNYMPKNKITHSTNSKL